MKQVSYKGVPFYLPEPGEKSNARDVGMAYWFKDSVKSALSYIEQQLWVHSFVKMHKLSILEVFAGIGCSTAGLPATREITRHVGIDHDAINLHAFSATHPYAVAYQGDSYFAAPMFLTGQDAYFDIPDHTPRFDYVLAEFNAITMYRAMTDLKEKQLMDAIFAARPVYISFVDSAKVKLHLQYKTYSKFFGVDIQNTPTYVDAVRKYIKEKYDYAMVACAYDSVNFTYLFQAHAPQRAVDLQDARTLVNMEAWKC